MTSWQKRLRTGVAIFGIVFAGLVYRSIGERRVAPPSRPVERFDPTATSETTGVSVQQVRGTEREFEIKSERSLSYDDGSAKHLNVEITVHRDGRVFVISAKEALAGAKQVELQLSGGVKLSASDGFELETDHGTFNQKEGIARAPDRITFKKGRMSGSGVNATYDQKGDVLNIKEQSKVILTDDSGRVALDSNAGSATLDRLNDVLYMDSAVRVTRDTQVINADKVMARLSADEDVITYLELRGNASVRGGGGPLDSMKANAIDLDYTDDGTALERAILNGSASFTTAPEEHVSSRRMSGEGLEVQIAPGGTVTNLVGRDGVQFELPSADKTPPRSISARTLSASGEPGRGLNTLRFRNDVVFREGDKSAPSFREVRAQSLNAALDGDGLRNAFFSGGVTFKERGFDAGALEVRYQPEKGILNLSGVDNRVWPHVTDELIHVDAGTIDVTLDGHGMVAEGNVRTSLSGRSANAKEQSPDAGRLPGLLKEGQAASINAERLEYTGGNGRAEYSGTATLVQGDTAIRGDRIVLDQQKGDLTATGSARSTLILETGRTDGRANEIRYDESARTVTYSAPKVAPTSGQVAAAALAQVSGPDGDLRAEQIEIVLAREGNSVERLEAYTRVTMVLGMRTAVGGRLTYHAQDERYVMSGNGTRPVSIRESSRETTGRNLIFFKSTERIIVDGNETRRTETRPTTSQPSPATPQPSPVTR